MFDHEPSTDTDTGDIVSAMAPIVVAFVGILGAAWSIYRHVVGA